MHKFVTHAPLAPLLFVCQKVLANLLLELSVIVLMVSNCNAYCSVETVAITSNIEDTVSRAGNSGDVTRPSCDRPYSRRFISARLLLEFLLVFSRRVASLDYWWLFFFLTTLLWRSAALWTHRLALFSLALLSSLSRPFLLHLLFLWWFGVGQLLLRLARDLRPELLCKRVSELTHRNVLLACHFADCAKLQFKVWVGSFS